MALPRDRPMGLSLSRFIDVVEMSRDKFLICYDEEGKCYKI